MPAEAAEMEQQLKDQHSSQLTKRFEKAGMNEIARCQRNNGQEPVRTGKLRSTVKGQPKRPKHFKETCPCEEKAQDNLGKLKMRDLAKPFEKKPETMVSRLYFRSVIHLHPPFLFIGKKAQTALFFP